MDNLVDKSIEEFSSYVKKLSPSIQVTFERYIEDIKKSIDETCIKIPLDSNGITIRFGDRMTNDKDYVTVLGYGENSNFYGVDDSNKIKYCNSLEFYHVNKNTLEECLYDYISSILEDAVDTWAHGDKYYIDRDNIKEFANELQSKLIKVE